MIFAHLNFAAPGASDAVPTPAAKKVLAQLKQDSAGNQTWRTRGGHPSIGVSYFYRSNGKGQLENFVAWANKTYFPSTGFKLVLLSFEDEWRVWPKTSYMWARYALVRG